MDRSGATIGRHACTAQAHPALHARVGRTASAGGAGRDRLSPGIRLGPGRTARGRVFFTLSGYLITDLLLSRLGPGGCGCGDSGSARARRLLPALFLMLAVVVGVGGCCSGPPQPPQFREAAAAAALYVSNWQLVVPARVLLRPLRPHLAAGAPVVAGGGGAVLHPSGRCLLLLGTALRARAREPCLACARGWPAITLVLAGWPRRSRWRLLYRPSFDPSRIYFGTDTRAFELLVGSGAGDGVAEPPPARGTSRRGRRRDARLPGGACGCGGDVVAVLGVTNQYSAFIYRGGLALLTLACVMLSSPRSCTRPA